MALPVPGRGLIKRLQVCPGSWSELTVGGASSLQHFNTHPPSAAPSWTQENPLAPPFCRAGGPLVPEHCSERAVMPMLEMAEGTHQAARGSAEAWRCVVNTWETSPAAWGDSRGLRRHAWENQTALLGGNRLMKALAFLQGKKHFSQETKPVQPSKHTGCHSPGAKSLMEQRPCSDHASRDT